MKVTFAILCYNYGQYLAQAIDSCLIQAAPGFETETLVIDDGSTDNTPEVCASFGSRIRTSRTANQGFGHSLTRAMMEARGEYVFLLDADDYFEPQKLAVLAGYLQRKIPFVSHTKMHVDKMGALIPGGIQSGGNTSTVCVLKSASMPLLPVTNELYFHAIYRAGHGIFVQQPLTRYRLHGSSMTDRSQPGKWNTYLANMTHGLADRIETLGPENTSWIDSMSQARIIAKGFRAQAYYNELEACLELRQRCKAWCKLWRMIQNEIAAHKQVSFFVLKMILRTILMRPSIPNARPTGQPA